MLNKEVIQRVQSLYSKGVQSDDTRLSDRHIYNKLTTVRARLLTEQRDKKQFLSQWNYQRISCIEMVQKPAYECPCIPPAGCYMWRSKHQLPEPITSNTKHLIQYVANLTGSIIFDETNFHFVKYRKGNKYTSNKNEYFFENKYLWLVTRKNETGEDDIFRVATMSALFEDPASVEGFIDFCSDNPCKNCPTPEGNCLPYQDREFPLDNDLIDRAILMTIEELIGIPAQLKLREDTTTDTRDSLNEESK